MNNTLPIYFSHTTASLRPVSDDDITPLVQLINDAYAYQDDVKGRKRTSFEHLRNRVSETDFYIISEDDNIIGCVYLEPKKPALHFGLLTLVPEHRDKGIAEAVMAALDEYAVEHHFGTIDLDYMSLAPWLKKYYEKYGFSETGEVTPWGTIKLVRMQKQIKTVNS